MKLDTLRQNYGIYIITLWSVVLGMQNLSNLLGITLSTRDLAPTDSPASFLAYQWISLGFSLAFFVVAVGLWRKANWGRVSFLIVTMLFFIVSTIGLLTPQLSGPTTPEKWWLGGRYVISTILPFVYLNLEAVKIKFKPTFEEDINWSNNE